jgi:protein SCO1/2
MSFMKNISKTWLYSLVGLITIISIIVVASIANQSSIEELDVIMTPGDFTLPSIDGSDYTFSTDSGKIRVLSFIYTDCQMGCGVVTANMAKVRNALNRSSMLGLRANLNDVKFVTIDFDYENDSMSDLQDYANKFSSDLSMWQFVMGDKTQTDEIAQNWNFSFNYSSMMQMYIHPFVLYIVDGEGLVRRMFLGLDWETEEVVETINFLASE